MNAATGAQGWAAVQAGLVAAYPGARDFSFERAEVAASPRVADQIVCTATMPAGRLRLTATIGRGGELAGITRVSAA